MKIPQKHFTAKLTPLTLYSQNFHYTNSIETPTSPFNKKQKIHLKLDHRSDPVLLKVKKTKTKKGTAKGPEVQQPSKQFGNTDKLKENLKSESTQEQEPG